MTMNSDMKDFEIEKGKLIKYKGSGGDVTIPEGVTSIGAYAFAKCESLTSVTIPEGVTSIGKEAFAFCDNLTRMTIPESVTDIETSVFYNCNKPGDIICYTSYVMYIFYFTVYRPGEHLNLIYLGGPIAGLPVTLRIKAAYGFIYALEQGIKDADQWREENLEFIRNKAVALIVNAKDKKHVVLFLVREKLLNEFETKALLQHYENPEDLEVKEALLQYYREQFGTDSPGDFHF